MIEVKAGQSIRSAVLNAPPSETIVSVEAGAVFSEILEPPARDRSTPLVIQSSRANELDPSKRASPADAAKMPKLMPPVGDGGARVLKTAPGAHHYNFVGLEFTHDPTRDIHTLISLGDAEQKTLEEIPHSLVFDRCYIHGHKDRGSVRGIALNSAKTDILNCYISDIHSADVDSQAVCGWTGPGPFRILNSYLEGAGENVMFGGGDPQIQGLIPSDIEIKRCHFFKPLSWKISDPSFGGKAWVIKNLFETKNARRLVVEGNLFENNWTHGQSGFGILIKCNNQDSTAPWSVTEDLLFQHNIVRSEKGLNMLLIENPPKISAIGKRIFIRNNMWYVEATVFQGPNDGEDVEFSHNTWFSGQGNNFTFYGNPTKRLVFNNNLGAYAGYGIRGSGEGVGAGVQEGTATFNAYSPGTWTAKGNVIPGANPSQYPPDNFYPATWEEVQYDSATNSLKSTSPFKGKGTDGKDPGCDWNALLVAQSSTTQPSQPQPVEPAPLPTQPTPTPTPAPTKTESPDGTKATTILDSQLATWTIGPSKETLRDGKHVGGGLGTLYKYLNKTIHVLGLDAAWWRFEVGGVWTRLGTTEPGVVTPTPTPVPQPTPTPVPQPVPTPTPAPTPASPRALRWPTSVNDQMVLIQAQAAESYRPTGSPVPRPVNQPKGTYVEFVKFLS